MRRKILAFLLCAATLACLAFGAACGDSGAGGTSATNTVHGVEYTLRGSGDESYYVVSGYGGGAEVAVLSDLNGRDITAIESFALSNCTAVTDVTIGEKVETIGDYAFFNCSALTRISIPAGVKDIGLGAFDGCTALTAVYYGGTEEQWKAIMVGDKNGAFTGATVYYTSET